MDRDANYVTVGAFVVLVIAMATVFVLWYTNARDSREYQRYEIYFTGSVSGLNEGSTVRYLGVNVGRVSRIELDPRAADRVLVLVELASDTPVNRNTLARLTPQGVTGLLFIDLAQAPPNQRGVSPDVPSQKYPVIRSMPSNLDLFLNGLPDLVASANDVITRIAGLLNDENVAAMNATLANVRAASDTLPGTTRDVARLVAELRGTVTEAQAAAASVNRMLDEVGPEVGPSAKRLREASDNLASITARVDRLLKTREPELDRFTSTGLGDFEQLVRESRDAVAEVRELARTLRENPSGLLYEREPTGVEIQR